MISLYSVIHTLFTVYTMMLVVTIFSSWFRELDQFQIIRFVRAYTEPYLAFFRRFIPPLGMIDFSPIVAFFFLRILEGCVMGILFS